MATNVEVKARVSDLAAVRAIAASLASTAPAIITQTDTYFAVAGGRLKVRMFEDGSGELISYVRPDQAVPKASDYTRVACENARAVVDALAAVLPVRGTVEKRREVFLVGRTRVHLDEVFGLGRFVELEVVLDSSEELDRGRDEAIELLRQLGISGHDLLAGSYIDLLGELETGAAAAGQSRRSARDA